MNLSYTMEKDNLSQQALQALFQSVEWASGRYPEELHGAIHGSHCVVTAWDGDKLVGLVNALSDGVMTAYFHYMLVDPAYQGHGIGQALMERILEFYSGYRAKVLVAYPEVVNFYKKLGFSLEEGTAPMFISELV